MHNYLMSILMIMNNIIGLFIAVRFYNHILLKKDMNQNVRRIGLVSVLSAAIILNIVVEELGILLLIGFTVFFLIANLFYMGKVHIKLITAVFLIVFSFFTELLTALLFAFVFGGELLNIRENLMYLFLGGVVSKIFLIILVEVIIRYRGRNASKVSLGSWMLIVSISIVSIFLAIASVYEPIIENKFSSVSVLYCISILYVNIILFYLFDNIVIQVDENNQYKFREKQMLMQQNQYENIITGYNQVKKIRHDMLGHLITLDGYLSKNQNREAVEYICKLNEELDFNQRGIISNNVVVDALINNRKSRAVDVGIEFEMEIIIPSKLKIDDMDLCIVLGNALNNALEACLRLVDEHVEKKISLKMKYKRECLLIELKNSYDINTIKKRSGRFISSKLYLDKDEIGTGIGNIESITEKYGGVCRTELLERVFVTKIMLPDTDVG